VDVVFKVSRDDAEVGEAFVPEKLRSGLDLLLDAYRCAQDAGRSAWDFAVGLASLQAAALGHNALRWLVCKGYVEHKQELTGGAASGRTFREEPLLIFHHRTRFALTAAGADFAGSRLDDLPLWDVGLREFRVGGRLIKYYRVPSPNQEGILAAFQEEGWPPRIDDPLPPHGDHDPKRRLRDTIKSLNRHQTHRLIRFTGDGTGEGVRWHRQPRS
jgi:hypothetical protein